jgi:hypothetical protein
MIGWLARQFVPRGTLVSGGFVPRGTFEGGRFVPRGTFEGGRFVPRGTLVSPIPNSLWIFYPWWC